MLGADASHPIADDNYILAFWNLPDWTFYSARFGLVQQPVLWPAAPSRGFLANPAIKLLWRNRDQTEPIDATVDKDAELTAPNQVDEFLSPLVSHNQHYHLRFSVLFCAAHRLQQTWISHTTANNTPMGKK